MAITYFGRTAVPVDNDATGNPGPTVTFTPPASMVADDFVLVLLTYKSSSTTLTFSATTTGGQTWTSETSQRPGSPATMSQWWKCKYNGTWSANPVFTISSGGTSPMQGVMLVFRGVDTTTPIDNADTGGNFAAPSTPFDVTITGIDPTTDGAMVVAAWNSLDDNSWALQTGGWANPSSETQWRNLSGGDQSISIAYLVVASGSSGNVTNRQAVITGDAGISHIIALRPAAGGSPQSLTMPTLASGAAINVPTLTVGAVALTLPTIASGAALNAMTLTPGSVSLTLPTIAAGSVLNAPTLAMSLALPTIASGAVINVPTLTVGAVSITLPTIASGAALNVPTLTPGAVTLTLPTIVSGEVLNAPTLTVGAITITLPTIASGEVLFAPEVANVIADNLAMPTIASGAVLFAPTLTAGAVAITLPTIASAAALFAPTVENVGAPEIILPFIDSTAVLFPPALTGGAVEPPVVVSASGGGVRSYPLAGPTGTITYETEGTISIAVAFRGTFRFTPARVATPPRPREPVPADLLSILEERPAPEPAIPPPLLKVAVDMKMRMAIAFRGGDEFYDTFVDILKEDDRRLLELLV